MRKRTASFLLASAAVSVAAYWPGCNVSMPHQATAWTGLLSASGTAMAISGVWVGLVFPQALKSILDGTRANVDASHLAMAEHLRNTLVLSCLVLLGCVSALPLMTAIAALQPPAGWVPLLRGLGFSVLVAFSCAQMFALLLVLGLGEEVRAAQRAKRKLDDSRRKSEELRDAARSAKAPNRPLQRDEGAATQNKPIGAV